MNVDTGAGSLSAEENAFFESGGQTEIPSDAGTVTAGNGSEGSGAPPVVVDDKSGDQGKPGGDTAPKTVPLNALHEERTRRKASDTALRSAETQLAELRGKFSIVERLGLGADPAAAAPGPVKPEDDIFGAVNSQGETLAQIQKRLDDADAATAATAEQNTFVGNYKADVATFTGKTPDFKAAYDFVLGSRANELLAIGYDNPADPSLTPAEAAAAAKMLHDAIVADEYAIADMAFKKGKSPAEILYGLAVQRGYKKAAPGAAPAADTGSAAEILANIERGQAANKSLGNAGGGSGEGQMTAEALLSMPIGQFEAWCNKNPDAAKAIMGG